MTHTNSNCGRNQSRGTCEGDASDLWSVLCEISEERFTELKAEIEFVFKGRCLTCDETYECSPDQEAVEIWEEVFGRLTYWGWQNWVGLNKEEIDVIAGTVDGSIDEVIKCSICACVTEVFSPYFRLQSPTEFRIDAGMSYGVGLPVTIVDEFDEY